MIITETIKLKMNSKTISHYIELGYNVNVNEIYDIKVSDLTKGSKVEIVAKCDICGKEKNVPYREYCRNTSKYDIFCCSNKCSTIKNKKTSLEKYGVDHFSKTNEFIEKMESTNFNKFGFAYYAQTKEYKEIIKNKNLDYNTRIIKQKETCLEKYGTENYHQSEEYKSKKNNIINKYKTTVTKKLLKKFSNLISTDNKNYKFLCEKGHEFELSRELLKNRSKLTTKICTICNPIGSSKSGYEIQLFEFISNNISTEILKNNRTFLDNKYELDIYLPELKLAFEFNGLYWHNELNKENNYHLDKTELCKCKGIQLIHIWEDDWTYKQEIIKSIILNKLNKTQNKIYVRKCEIKEISDNKMVNKFLDENHLQGSINSSIKIGLFFNNELYSLMTFGKQRISLGQKSIKHTYELLRFCNKLNTNIVGGASKLFNYFLNVYKPEKIITYADRSHSNGDLYYKLKFNFIYNTIPNYYYIIDGIRQNRFSFRKDILILEGYDPYKTEHQIMTERGYYRIYDSGSMKFEMNP